MGVDFRGRLRWTYALTTTTGGILKGRGKRGQQTGLKSSTTLGQWRNHSLINYSIFRYPKGRKEVEDGVGIWAAPLMESDGLHRSGTISLTRPAALLFLSSIISIWQGSMPFFFFLYFPVGWFFFFFFVYSNNKGIIFAAFNNNESLLKGFERRMSWTEVGSGFNLWSWNEYRPE